MGQMKNNSPASTLTLAWTLAPKLIAQLCHIKTDLSLIIHVLQQSSGLMDDNVFKFPRVLR